jgi:hypothetical protein
MPQLKAGSKLAQELVAARVGVVACSYGWG